MRNLKQIGYMFILAMLIANIAFPLEAYASTIKEQFHITEHVHYKDIEVSDSTDKQRLRVMEINTNDPDTFIDLGLTSELGQTRQTTALANDYSKEGYHVLGAINGSFYHMHGPSFQIGMPMNLIAIYNQVIQAGEVYESKGSYVNEPIAFGVNAEGKNVIDYFNFGIRYVHNGNAYDITTTNKNREENDTILYTPDFPEDTTETNPWGVEVVVTLPEKPVLEFDSKVVGTVTSIRERGNEQPTVIPENGFVLSGHGMGSHNLENMSLGDSITLEVHIDNQWKDSAFMLASGPLLVKDGKVNITMDPGSANAGLKAPRTAIAINKTGEKVYFITVDGRQKGYSDGMTITQFAEYLAELGVDRALNLDGGGSTTMGVRYPQTTQLALANKPSDGRERGVPSILMAVTSAPVPVFPDVSSSHWAFDSILSLFNRGTITGYQNGTFRPDQDIRRSHVALMLARQFNLDTDHVVDPEFKDVSKSDLEYGAIAAAVQAGLFEGKGEGLFGKNASLTRAEMATIVKRAFDIPDTDTSYFTDTKGHWAFDAINAIADQGVADGYPDGTYQPEKNVSRAEFSKFLVEGEKIK